MKLAAAALVLLATTAYAGGIERPNGMSARAVGMGGAFTAWADDSSAVYFNPAALTEIDPQVNIGGELVIGPRSYTPVADDGTRGAPQKTTIIAPVPAAGVVGRFSYDDVPSRFTLGAGVWNTGGGKVTFPMTGMPGIDSSEDIAIEAAGAAAFRVSDRLSVGAAVRFGYGLFSDDSTMAPSNAHLTASGVGVSLGLGALVRPTETIRIGIAWRAPMHIATTGDGTIEVVTGSPTQTPIEHDQTWPQQASLGVGWQPAPRIKLAAQLDWTQWSASQNLTVTFPTGAAPDFSIPEGWSDTWTARLGGEYVASQAIALRAGAYFDTNAIPDRTAARQYLDSNKVGVAAGASVRIDDWRVDAAVDLVLPSTRTVPNNTAETMAFPADRNLNPGDYAATLVTFELAITRRF